MMLASEMLNNLEDINETVESAVTASAARFEFMTDRFLVAIGVVPANRILGQPVYMVKKSDFYALSLPETIKRRRAIARLLPAGCEVFDGIRHNIGWIGCGGSFSALSRFALENNLTKLTVIEDDVDLPDNFDNVLKEINDYLSDRVSNWDIFSGLMADVHPSAKILSVEEVNGRTYVTINRMTSTVFNIYNRSALEMISQWSPLNTDPVTNTIDRYLERQSGLRVVVALPFIAGHKEEATSTLWGFENDRYTPMITHAQEQIEAMVREWRLLGGTDTEDTN